MELINDWFKTIGHAVRQAITGHPTENTLIEIALSKDNVVLDGQGRSKLENAQEHMRHCKRCTTVFSEINATLIDINQSGHSTAHAIPDSTHRRFRQRSKIMRRIDAFLAPPATVLRFPFITTPALIRFTPLTVCLVIICAAGPFLGGWQKSPSGGGGGSTWKGTAW